jgi:hypothetical protein
MPRKIAAKPKFFVTTWLIRRSNGGMAVLSAEITGEVNSKLKETQQNKQQNWRMSPERKHT